jgi:hypothetical protein
VKNSVIALLLHCCVYVFLSSACGASAGKDDPTIVSFTRHTFRGAAQEMSPQEIALKKYGIDVNIPLLSYAQDATPRGLDIAKQFGSEGLNKAAACAVRALSGDLKFCEPQADIEDQTFDGHWHEFRVDLSTQRTFWTAIKVREGLEESLTKPTQPRIALRGCKTTPGEAIDTVCTRPHMVSCAPSLAPSDELLLSLRARSNTLLTHFRTAIGNSESHPLLLPTPQYADGQIHPKEYEEVAKLANFIEMAAAYPFPIELVNNSTKAPQSVKPGKDLVTDALNMLGIRLFVKNQQVIDDHINVHVLEYMKRRPRGSHTAIFTHDDYLSSLLRSLELITEKSDASALAIYPLETVVFAFNDHHVAVSRTRLTVQENGSIPEKERFQDTTLVWHGSLDKWNHKVGKVHRRAGPPCLVTVNICEAKDLEVVY